MMFCRIKEEGRILILFDFVQFIVVVIDPSTRKVGTLAHFFYICIKGVKTKTNLPFYGILNKGEYFA